jgi:hypothetical protein
MPSETSAAHAVRRRIAAMQTPAKVADMSDCQLLRYLFDTHPDERITRSGLAKAIGVNHTVVLHWWRAEGQCTEKSMLFGRAFHALGGNVSHLFDRSLPLRLPITENRQAPTLYVLRDGEPAVCDDWSLWRGCTPVAHDVLPEGCVRTAFLHLDYNADRFGEPMLYESVTVCEFDNSTDYHYYATLEQAIAGHHTEVRTLRASRQ